MEKTRPPRAAFVDHPVGRTFGPPHSRERNLAVLRRALDEFSRFAGPGEIHDLGLQWEDNGSRAWEDDLRAEMLREH